MSRTARVRRAMAPVRRFTARLERIAAVVVALHLLGGAVCMHLIEGWELFDSLYFCVVTLATVGFGDMAPITPTGRLFVSGYVLVGFTLVSAGLGALVAKAQSATARGKTGRPDHRRALGSAAAMAGCIVIVGALGANMAEGWGLIDSLYWAVVTCSSVGFGDLTPSDSSRAVAALYILASVAGFASAAGRVASAVASAELEAQIDEFVGRGVSEDLVREIDGDGDGTISRDEYLRFMLVATGRLEAHDLRLIDAQFDELDEDGDGLLRTGDSMPPSPRGEGTPMCPRGR